MSHAQKPDFVFRRNGRVHLNRRGRQFSRLLAAEVCASAVVMLDAPCSEVVWRVLVTHFIRQFPLHVPFRASPCTITFQLDSPRTITWCMVFIRKKRHTFKKVLPHWYQTKPCYQMTTLAQNVKFATHIFGFFRRVFKFAKKKKRWLWASSSVRVCTHGITRLPLDVIFMILRTGVF
jgi:hypothetical protein